MNSLQFSYKTVSCQLCMLWLCFSILFSQSCVEMVIQVQGMKKKVPRKKKIRVQLRRRMRGCKEKKSPKEGLLNPAT